MTHRQPPRLPLLLLLTLTALAGCDPRPPPAPPTEQNYSEVQFDVTVPLETPVDATLLLMGEDPAFKGPSGQGLELVYQGGNTFTVKARMPKDQELTYHIRMTAPDAHVALDAAGTAVPARTIKAHENEENASFSVERWGPESGVTGPRTVFLVAVPETTSPQDGIWLSGNHPLLGNWNGAGVKLHKAMNSGYATVLSFDPDTSLEFKTTRGSWETVEKGAQGEEFANRTHKTGTGFERVSFTVSAWADVISVPPEQVLTGRIEYLRDVTPTNTQLKKRDVIIWLPPGYDETDTTRRYPVLYMHDGQNLMDATTGFPGAGEWGVDETAQALVEANEVEPLIIVGIYNTSDRGPEYTQVPDARYPEVDGANGGRADAYGQFIVNELKPMIDGKYLTRPEGKYTGLAGSSLGGLVTMYLGMKHPDTFTRLGVISPSVFWGQNDIVAKVNALPAKLPLSIWLDIGTDEGSTSQETVEDTRLLRDALVNKGWVLDTQLEYTEVPDGKHNEASWSARFGDILQYLYPPPPP